MMARNGISIEGGQNNITTGAFSSILGGSRNNDDFAYAGIIGQNVTDVAPNTFHVECLNAVNTPVVPLGPLPPSGTIFRYDVALGPLPVGALPLYIMP